MNHLAKFLKHPSGQITIYILLNLSFSGNFGRSPYFFTTIWDRPRRLSHFAQIPVSFECTRGSLSNHAICMVRCLSFTATCYLGSSNTRPVTGWLVAGVVQRHRNIQNVFFNRSTHTLHYFTLYHIILHHDVLHYMILSFIIKLCWLL